VLRKEETGVHVRRRWLGFQSWEVAAKEGSPRFRLGVLWAALSLLYEVVGASKPALGPPSAAPKVSTSSVGFYQSKPTNFFVKSELP
jgi:hypothetical protein